jgi:hypothetical protein
VLMLIDLLLRSLPIGTQLGCGKNICDGLVLGKSATAY